MADLVEQAVQKEVTSQLHKMQEMLQVALARITSLEEEIVKCNATPRAPRLPSSPSSSSSVCRHWLRNRCTWKDKCRFSHGGEVSDADSEGSYSAVIDAKDLEEVEMMTKVAEVKLTSSSSSCEVKLASSEIVGCLIKSNLPPRHQSVSGVHQQEHAGGALARTGFDSDVKPHGGLHCSLVENLLGDIVDKVVDSVAMRKEEERHHHMASTVDNIQAKYMEKYSPQKEGDIVYSAEVAVPVINFAKVKPHLHKNLPKPAQLPVQSCSPLPDFYRHCTICADANSKGQWAESHGLKRCAPPFEQLSPFGSLPGFETNLGVVAVPADPIGGYVYAGGWEADTQWQLHAEAVYI